MQVGFLYAGEYLDGIQPDYGQQWRALRDLYASLRDKRFSALGAGWTRHRAGNGAEHRAVRFAPSRPDSGLVRW